MLVRRATRATIRSKRSTAPRPGPHQARPGLALLAEGDHAAGPLGARTLGRNVRSGCAEPADEDAFVRIRLAYEGAASSCRTSPGRGTAWPSCSPGQASANAPKSIWPRPNDAAWAVATPNSTTRPVLRALVQAGLGNGPDGLPTAARPFPGRAVRPAPGLAPLSALRVPASQLGALAI